MGIDWNNLSPFDPRQLRQIARFVSPPGLGQMDVLVKRTRSRPYSGVTYWRADPVILVELAIGDDHWFPHYRRPEGRDAWRGYLKIGWLHTPEECIVFLMAHEFRHVWQIRQGWDCNALAESDADLWGINCLLAWRN